MGQDITLCRPTETLIDSQSVKTAGTSEVRIYDVEKTKVIERQIVIDEIENLLSVVVHAADLHDTKVGIWAAIFAYVVYPSIRKFNADGEYRENEKILGGRSENIR